MLKVIVKIDLNKDALNWWEACNKVSHGIDWKLRISKRLQNKVVGKTQSQAFAFLIPYLKKLYRHEHIETERIIVQEIFDERQAEIFRLMEWVTGKKIYRDSFTCWLTTFPRAPYNVKSGFVWLPIQWRDRSIDIFLHELLHFQTLYYYQRQMLRSLSAYEADNLKEALTVILNVSFGKTLTQYDMGYRIHSYLRKDLLKYWKANQNFNKLISHGIRVYPKYADTIKYLKPGKYTTNIPVWLLKKVQRVKQTKIDKKYIYAVLRIIKDEFNKKKHQTTYTNIFAKSRFISTKNVLRKRQTSCGSIATVVASVFRTLGIPTKLINGYMDKKGELNRHAWNEIYIPTMRKFIPFDITRKNLHVGKRHIRKDEWVDWGEMEAESKANGVGLKK